MKWQVLLFSALFIADQQEEAGQSNINATHPNHIIHSLLLYGLFSVLLSPTWNFWKIVGWSDVI